MRRANLDSPAAMGILTAAMIYLALSLFGMPVALGAEAPAATLLPENPLLAVVVRDGDQRVLAVRDWLDARGFFDTPLYDRIETNKELTQARIVLLGLATSAGTDPWHAIGSLLGRESALGVVAQPGHEPGFVLVSRLREPVLADRVLGGVLALTGLVVDGKPDPKRSRQVGDVTAYAVDDDLYLCRADDALILSNTRDVMRAVLARRAAGEHGLAGTPRYKRAQAMVPPDAAAWAVADTRNILAAAEDVRESTDASQAGKLRNPLGAFLFGGWHHVLQHADATVAWVTAKQDQLDLAVRAAGKIKWPEALRGFAQLATSQVVWDASKLPGFLGQISVARNWADLFAEREALVTLRGVSEINDFATTMSTIFGGMDFLNDMLPAIGSPVRLIAARQDFNDTDGVPILKLPAFALVMPLREAALENMTRRLFSASQMGLSLINLGMAEEGRPAYLIDMDRYRGHRILFTEFSETSPIGRMRMDPAAATSTPDEPTTTGASTGPATAGIERNFAPAIAVVEGQYIIATSRPLLEKIIDAIVDATPSGRRIPPAGTIDGVHIDGQAVLALLRENRTELVTNRMLEEDLPRDRAEEDIALFFDLVDYANDLTVTSTRDENGYAAAVTLRLRSKENTAAE